MKKPGIFVVTSDGRLRDVRLPLDRSRIEIVANGSVCFAADEERIVCEWCRSVSISGIEDDLPEDIIQNVLIDGKRTSSDQDRILAEWVLRVWVFIETIRNLN